MFAFSHRTFILGLVVSAAGLVSCSGSNTVTPLPGASPQPSPSPRASVSASPAPTATATMPAGTPMGTARLTFSVALPASVARARLAQSYISPKTQSLLVEVVAVNGSAPAVPISTVANVGSGASGCSVTGTTLNCTITIAAPAGSDTFRVRTYALPLAAGAPISIATPTATIVVNQTNDVPLSFAPIVASIAVSISPAAGTMGTPATFTATINAKDATGDVIGGSDSYYSPIGVTTGDTSGHVTATPALPASITAPGQSVAFAYDGGPATSYTFTVASAAVAGIGGVAPVNQTISFAAAPAQAAQHLYVSSESNAVYVYDIAADGSITGPSRTISGPLTTLSDPQSLMVDDSGALYVVNRGRDVTVYAAGANGNVAPIATLGTGYHPVYVGANGYGFDIVGPAVAGDDSTTTVVSGTIYPDPQAGPVIPINFRYPYLDSFALPYVSGGQIIAPIECGGQIVPGNNGQGVVACFADPVPTMTVSGITSGSSAYADFAGSPQSVAFRRDGLLAVAQGTYYGSAASIASYPVASVASRTPGGYNTSPAYLIQGSQTGLAEPAAIAFDAHGNMYVDDAGLASGQGKILVWPPAATGNVAPAHVVSGLNLNFGVAVGK